MSETSSERARVTQPAAAYAAREVRVDGARMRYLDVGEGEVVLLLHGYPQSAQCWRHQIERLSRSHRVLAPDWLGFGRSERRLDVAPDYAAEVERIGQFASRVGVQTFNLVGHDYGGHVGLGFVARHPQRVLRFALLNSRAHGTFRPGFYRFSMRQHWIASHALARWLARALPLGAMHRRGFQRYLSLGCFSQEQLDEYVSWMDEPAGRAWYFHFFAHYYVPVRPELGAALAHITCPTAIIWGTRDPYIPLSTAHELAERIPRATLSLVEGADHFVMEERPSEVCAALEELLARPV